MHLRFSLLCFVQKRYLIRFLLHNALWRVSRGAARDLIQSRGFPRWRIRFRAPPRARCYAVWRLNAARIKADAWLIAVINRSSWATSRRHMFIARIWWKAARTQFNLIARVISRRPPRARTFSKPTQVAICEPAALDARAEQRVRYLFVMRIAIRRAAASVIVIASERARTHNEPYD